MQIITIGNADYDSERNGLIILRSYYFSFNSSKIIDEYKYKNKTYLRILASLDNNNKFSIEMQDYLYSYDKIDTKVMIEYSTGKIKIVDLENYKYKNNSSSSRKSKKCYITISDGRNSQSSYKLKKVKIIIIVMCVVITFIIILVKHFKNNKDNN